MRVVTATMEKETGDPLYAGIDDPRIIMVWHNGREMQTVSARRLDSGEWEVTFREVAPLAYQWPAGDGETAFVDILAAPKDWDAALAAMGVTFERSEPQPIADQIKLHGCSSLPADLPGWLRRPSR